MDTDHSPLSIIYYAGAGCTEEMDVQHYFSGECLLIQEGVKSLIGYGRGCNLIQEHAQNGLCTFTSVFTECGECIEVNDTNFTVFPHVELFTTVPVLPTDSSTANIAWIAAPILFAIILTAVAIGIYRYRRAIAGIFWNVTGRRRYIDGVTLEKTTILDLHQLKLDLLDPSTHLGDGVFGTVYKAQYKEKEVALKLPMSNHAPECRNSILNEIKVLQKIGCHPNVVSMIGVILDKEGLYLLLEYCSKGSAKDYLMNEKSVWTNATNNALLLEAGYILELSNGECHSPFEIEKRKQEIRNVLARWAQQVATGLAFLHLRKVLHIDLAARNILVDHSVTAKIADFGISKKLYGGTYYKKDRQVPLPMKWMALESMLSHKFSEKSDIWSYAVTVWELYAMGDDPYSQITICPQLIHFLKTGGRLGAPTLFPKSVYELLLQCWDVDPLKRPNLSDIAMHPGFQ